jgi:hypothetical protein
MKRVLFDLILIVLVFAIFGTHTYEILPPPIQLVALKALLVSAGVLHAHIVRKLLFPKIDWETDIHKGKIYAAIAFYVIIPIGYAFGG